MRDVHCHILPGVDDGSRNMAESLRMIDAATKAGITSIVCTPHCRHPWFNYEKMWRAFFELQEEIENRPLAPKLTMGFEVNYRKLMELGYDWIDSVSFQTGEFLLELPDGQLPSDWERAVYEAQVRGHKVIIAHPERYVAVQKDITVVEDFIRAGCKIQVSADFIEEGRFSHRKKTALKLFKNGLVDFIASDAHRPEDYEAYMAVKKEFMSKGAHAR